MTIAAKYLSQPITEYFKNVTRMRIAEKQIDKETKKNSLSVIFFHSIGKIVHVLF